MTTETGLRRHITDSTSGARHVVQTLVIVASILGVATAASAQPYEWSSIVGGTGSSADTAWGGFDTPTNWQVCTWLDPSILPPEPIPLWVLGGSVDFTSPPENVPNVGSISWTINVCHATGDVGVPLTGGRFEFPGEPPDSPIVESYTILVCPINEPIVYHPVNGLYFCTKTTNPEFHIAGWSEPGGYVRTSMNDGGFFIEQDVSAGYDLFLLGEVPSTPTHCSETYAPQAGAGPGSGAFFDTRITGYNPDTETMSRRLEIQQRGSPVWTTVYTDTLQVGEVNSVLLNGPVNDHFGGGAFGVTRSFINAVGVPSKANGDEVDVMSQAVIFATLPDGSEYGQYFQFRPADEALQAGQTGWLFTTHDPDRYRVNVGITAVADDTRVTLTPRGDGGVALASPEAVEFDEGGNTQFNDVYTRWGLGGATDVMVEVVVETGAAFVFSSILDGRGQVQGTSDPTTVLPVTEGSNRAVLLEVGRITGLNEFSGSASIFNHGASPVDVQVDFHERGVPGVSASDSFSLGAMEANSWDDAVGDLVNRTGVVGSLVFTVQGGKSNHDGISVIGREFAIFRDGGGAVSGTAGQAMPGLRDTDQLMPGETFHFIGLRDRQLADGPERSHLGMLNLGSGDVTVTVNGFADDGSPEGMIQTTVRGGEQLRVNNVLREINPGQDGGIKRIEVTVTGGALHALAYLVNSTGDPVTLLPFRR